MAFTDSRASASKEWQITPLRTVVIVPSLHRPDLTERCVRCLEGPQSELSEIVIVEDDGAAHPDEIYKGPFAPNMRQIVLSARHGFAGAVNAALAETESEFVLLLNNDVELAPDFLQKLLEALEKNPTFGFSTGRLVSSKDPSLLDGAGDEFLLAGGAYRAGHGSLDAPQFNQPRQLISGCGGATLYRRSALRAAGLFDEDLFAYLEDADLGLRLLLRGMKGIYVPSAVASHIGSATSGGPGHPFIFQSITRNQCLLVLKNYPASVLIRCLPRILIFQALWSWRALLRGSFVPYLKGICGAIWRLPGTLKKRQRNLAQRTISSHEFMESLRSSEAKIHEWQLGIPASERSTLLKTYFAIFRPRG